jgi:hypothetical protein
MQGWALVCNLVTNLTNQEIPRLFLKHMICEAGQEMPTVMNCDKTGMASEVPPLDH